MILVISTTGTPPPEAREKCLRSVASQRDVEPVRHVYLDTHTAPLRPDGFPHFPALIAHIAELDDEDIVCSLDGDDWLAHGGALARVKAEHDAGAWVTWGSFIYSDGRPGFAAPLMGDSARRAPWVTTHLKTFRAGLFKRIRHEHLKGPDGLWLENARDHALMFPVIEMAGPARCAFIPEVIYVYNGANSSEFAVGPSFVEDERKAAAYLRAIAPYARVEALSCAT